MNTEKIVEIRQLFELKIADADSSKSLESIKAEFCGKAGYITDLLKQLKNTKNSDERAFFGKSVNDLKAFIEEQLNSKLIVLQALETERKLSQQASFDVTGVLPDNKLVGNLHIYSKFCEEIENIFVSMGFELLEGPEVESDFFNFTALNIGENHPARDMYDTLWLDRPNTLLRTHTSPVQIRAMQTKGAPLAGIAMGRVFRHEALDATHEMIFNQCEGIMVNENINLSHLLGVAKNCLQKLFNKQNIDIRVRPGFFPFVVPGLEIDMRCVFCKSGCPVCKYSTWLEVFPGGLIHPKVLEYGGINPSKYSGFAFGFGVDRLIMLRHQIRDIRILKSGDIRFITQF